MVGVGVGAGGQKPLRSSTAAAVAAFERCRAIGRTIGDAERAIAHYAGLLEDHPDNTTVLGSLDALYLHTERWEELVDVLRQQIDITHDTEPKIGLWLRLADVLEARRSDPNSAAECYREVLYLEAAQPQAVDELWRL